MTTTYEASAVAGWTGEGAGSDTVSVGKQGADTEGPVEDKSRGGIDAAAAVSQQPQQLWPPSWECC